VIMEEVDVIRIQAQAPNNKRTFKEMSNLTSLNDYLVTSTQFIGSCPS
jgi:hypothetical protein